MIESFIATITSVAGGNPMVAASVMGMFALGLTGFMGFILKDIPSGVLTSIKRQLTMSFSLNDSNWGTEELFKRLDIELMRHTGTIGTRTLSLTNILTWSTDGERTDEPSMSLGVGRHFIRYNGKWFLVQKSVEVKNSSVVSFLDITTLARTSRPIRQLIGNVTLGIQATPKMLELDPKECSWRKGGNIPVSPLSGLCLAEETKRCFTVPMDFFTKNKDGYVSLGLPYKATFMLHGAPGTGKTSIIRSLAYEYKFNLAVINLADCTDTGLQKSLRSVPTNTIVVFEDIDTISVTTDREQQGGKTENPLNLGITLSGLLNALDGIAPLDGVVIFMTTNYIERIDKAITRPGRTDFSMEVPALPAKLVNDYLNRIYHRDDFDVQRTLKACDISSIKTQAKLDSAKAKVISTDF